MLLSSVSLPTPLTVSLYVLLIRNT